MRFMNEYDIDQAQQRWADHPVLGPAVKTLANLRDAANANSDGWHIWPKPARAAAKLMELIEGDGTNAYRHGPREDATPARLKAAYSPIKAFRTKSGIDFKIVEELAPATSDEDPFAGQPMQVEIADADGTSYRWGSVPQDKLEHLRAILGGPDTIRP